MPQKGKREAYIQLIDDDDDDDDANVNDGGYRLLIMQGQKSFMELFQHFKHIFKSTWSFHIRLLLIEIYVLNFSMYKHHSLIYTSLVDNYQI